MIFVWIGLGIIGLIILFFGVAFAVSMYLSTLSYDEMLNAASKGARTER